MLAPSCADGKNAGQTVLLGDCIVINDSTYSPKEAWPFVNYLDTGNITENRISEIQAIFSGKEKLPSRARRKVKAGDIVYSTVRPNQRHFGLVKEVPHNFLASTGFAVIRGKDNKAITDFIYWFLAQDHIVDHLQTIAEQNTSAYPSIKPSDIQSLELDLPPLLEQRAIAHILGTLDDKIELNRRMNETLEGMARALFKCWFVDFEPVRAKVEGRWRRGESLPGMPAELYELFPDGMVDSDLGEIPAGWEAKGLGAVANEVRIGAQPQSIKPGTPYIALEHMPKRCLSLSEWDVADGVGSSKFRFKRGDILFGKLRPYFHKVGIAPVEGVCSTDIVVVAPAADCWFGFVLGHISSDAFVDYTDTTSTGTRMPRTKWRDMARYEIWLPGRLLAEAFTLQIQPWVQQIVSAIHESRALASLRDTLLPRLISGKLQGAQRR